MLQAMVGTTLKFSAAKKPYEPVDKPRRTKVNAPSKVNDSNLTVPTALSHTLLPLSHMTYLDDTAFLDLCRNLYMPNALSH